VRAQRLPAALAATADVPCRQRAPGREPALTLASRWLAAWAALRLPIPEGAAFNEILARYREPQRAYHTDQHLAECLDWFDRVRERATEPQRLEMALWYHDAVYWPRRSDNERASAALASAHLATAGAAAAVTDRVAELIMYTAHQAEPPPGDAALLVDIDLTILGAAPARYAEYEDQIRREYAWVPGVLFRRRRAEILRAFLARPRLYLTATLAEQLEGQARTNLTESIRRLTGR
jgi:predicted metal-dependent HD superfamily phosphohydrolase